MLILMEIGAELVSLGVVHGLLEISKYALRKAIIKFTT